MENTTQANGAARVQTYVAHTRHSHVRAHIFRVICLSPAPYLHAPLIGDVSCLATKQSGPDCCHDNMAGVSSSWRE